MRVRRKAAVNVKWSSAASHVGEHVGTLIFGYQTLMDEKTRRKIFGHNLKPQGAAVLMNTAIQRWLTPEGHDFHTLVKKSNHHVGGLLFELDDAEVEALDRWEDEYNRTDVLLFGGIKAQAYVLKPEYKKHLEGAMK